MSCLIEVVFWSSGLFGERAELSLTYPGALRQLRLSLAYGNRIALRAKPISSPMDGQTQELFIEPYCPLAEEGRGYYLNQRVEASMPCVDAPPQPSGRVSFAPQNSEVRKLVYERGFEQNLQIDESAAPAKFRKTVGSAGVAQGVAYRVTYKHDSEQMKR